MNLQTLFQIIVAIAGSTVLSQVVNSIMQRKKVRAEAVDVLSDTALDQLNAALKQMAEMRIEVAEMRASQKQFRTKLYEHERWDRSVVRRLEEAGIHDIPYPPELWL